MFDRPFELSFEEGHRQSKLKKDKLEMLSTKSIFQEQFNQDAQKDLENNSNLVDFERGSTLGGLITAVVFVGFTFLLVYDLQYNISNRPYTFEVRDKFMAPEEFRATKVNFGDYEQSHELVIGFIAYHEDGTRDPTFNPFDNDYIEVFSTFWDSEIAREKNEYFLY